MNEFNLPKYITDILSRIEEAGFEAYLVGGSVRDMLLRQRPSDFDVATSAHPADIARIFEKAVPTGIKYGTVTVFMAENKAEITTFRSDARYDDFRRPSSVKFGGGILSDLSRRDFSVNAMAYNPLRGLIDPFHGQNDLESRVIRAVGLPDERFKEDALRILRAFRFASQLGFVIEEGTLRAAGENMALCARLSGERVRAELDRLLQSPLPSLIFRLADLGLFKALGVCLASTENAQRLDKTPASKHARWAGFLHMIGCEYEGLFERLKFDNVTKKKVALLLNELERTPPQTSADIKHRLMTLPPPLYRDYLCLHAALTGGDVSGLLLELDGIENRGEPYRPDMLAVSGSDLISAGYIPGSKIGIMLNEMLEYAIENPQDNVKEKLIHTFHFK